jgi:hypothetical protein
MQDRPGSDDPRAQKRNRRRKQGRLDAKNDIWRRAKDSPENDRRGAQRECQRRNQSPYSATILPGQDRDTQNRNPVVNLPLVREGPIGLSNAPPRVVRRRGDDLDIMTAVIEKFAEFRGVFCATDQLRREIDPVDEDTCWDGLPFYRRQRA